MINRFKKLFRKISSKSAVTGLPQESTEEVVLSKDTCGQCEHFWGSGDWDLCCSITHPTAKEKELGLTFPCGHLCYESTEACDMFDKRKN